MRFTVFFLCIISFFTVSLAQKPSDVLATMNGRGFTAQDLSPNTANAWIKLPDTLAKMRKSLLVRQIRTVLLETEAKEQKVTTDKLLEIEVYKKVPDPTEDAIKVVYDANSKDLVNVPSAEARTRIINYLRVQPEAKAREEYLQKLKLKHKIVNVKDVTSADLKPNDTLVTIGKAAIKVADFNNKNGLVLYEAEASVYDGVLASLKLVVDSALYSMEAQGVGLTPNEYMAREFTNKMTGYSDEEQHRLQTSLRKRLYKKYRVRFFISSPKPFVQKISVDDDPAIGNQSAPVTVVMFTDLQCPGCASVYPVLKKVISEYGNKVYFVIRDFPLTGIHENAFQAAVAANAARVQNKYFEYKELLYKNQDSLDTESLIKLARQLGLRKKQFASDLQKRKFADEVQKDIEDGKNLWCKVNAYYFLLMESRYGLFLRKFFERLLIDLLDKVSGVINTIEKYAVLYPVCACANRVFL